MMGRTQWVESPLYFILCKRALNFALIKFFQSLLQFTITNKVSSIIWPDFLELAPATYTSFNCIYAGINVKTIWHFKMDCMTCQAGKNYALPFHNSVLSIGLK